METPPFMKSWVNLCEPSTPPHASASAAAGDQSPAQPPAAVTPNMSTGFSSLASSPTPPIKESLAEQYDVLGPSNYKPRATFTGEEYMRLLREAQREGFLSNCGSRDLSRESSLRTSPRGASPKSPPNSPNPEEPDESTHQPLSDVFINYTTDNFVKVASTSDTDWHWDWNSRPDQRPPKEWRLPNSTAASSSAASDKSTSSDSTVTTVPPTVQLLHKTNKGVSLRRVMVGKAPLFSREVLYTILISNVLSLIFGAGIGAWLSRRSVNSISVVPFN